MGNGFSWDFGRVKVFLWRWEGVVWDRVTGRIIEREVKLVGEGFDRGRGWNRSGGNWVLCELNPLGLPVGRIMSLKCKPRPI